MDDAVAAFLAKGGKITKVGRDETSGMTARDWQQAVRGEQPVRGSDEWHREMGFVAEANLRARGR